MYPLDRQRLTSLNPVKLGCRLQILAQTVFLAVLLVAKFLLVVEVEVFRCEVLVAVPHTWVGRWQLAGKRDLWDLSPG